MPKSELKTAKKSLKFRDFLQSRREGRELNSEGTLLNGHSLKPRRLNEAIQKDRKLKEPQVL